MCMCYVVYMFHMDGGTRHCILSSTDVHTACVDHNPNLYNYASDQQLLGKVRRGSWGKTWNVGSTISLGL